MMPQPKVWIAVLLLGGVAAVWVPRFLPGEDTVELDEAAGQAAWSPRPRAEDRPLPAPTSGSELAAPAELEGLDGLDGLDGASRTLLELARELRGGGPEGERLWPPAAATSPAPDPDSDPVAGASSGAGLPPAWDLPAAAALELEAVRASHPLTATLVGPDGRTAVLGGNVLRVGDRVVPDGPRVVAIEARRVRLELDGVQLDVGMVPFRVAARAAGATGRAEEEDEPTEESDE